MTNFLFIKNLETKLLGFLILLFLLSAGLNAQNTVSGVVSDKDGPVPGVNVSVKGMKISTSTNMDGSYVLKSIPEKAVLVFSYISYKNKEVAVNGQKTINVVLESDVTTLSNVVVVGYGTMKRTDLTGSVASVSSEAIKNSVTTSIEQVLQGRAAGVDVQQNSGAPGAGSSIRIRGVSSITGSNEPVFVIDGVIVEGTIGSGLNSGTDNSLGSVNPLAAINPADIVSIDILKDASATAIYGSRAANGVIMVTTKRGRKGELNLTFNSSVGWQQIPKRLSVLNLREFATHKNTLAVFGILVRDNSFVRADLLGEGTNWQEEIFTKAMIQNYNLSASGGSDKTTYAMSLGYLDQAGIAIGSGFNRSNLSGNLDSQVKDYLKVGATFALSNTAQKTTFSDGALILTALRQTPNVAVRNADGSFDGPATSEFVQTNPVALVLLKDNNNTKLGIRANTYLEIAFTKALKFKTQYSLDFNFNNDYKFDPSYTFGALNNTVRSGSRTASNSKFWNWENILTYNKKLGKSNINAMLGQEMNKTTWESLYGYRAGYLTNGATDLNAGDATTAKNSNSSGAKSMSSYFGRVFYSFDDKYLLTATLRRDGSSSFAPEKRWDWFPSAALAWKVSNENFLKNNSIINNLKLRLGWGLVGNQNAPLYAYTSVYATSATNWGTGLLAKNTPNPFLGWETTSSSNLGIDLSLLNNRIEVVADVYYKATNNLILDLILPDYLGINGTGSTAPPTENIGSLENKGIEFTVNTKNIKGKDFSWNSNVVFSLNRNKVLKMNTETGVLPQKLQQGSDVTTLTRTVAGQPIGQFYGYEVIGRFEKATDFYYKNTQGVVTPTALPTGMKIAENSV
ncbi:MAG: hypothetical protein QG594_785, partial [Bacteroidota bacterium]|nr:hypothetical protein [Bacteroidota bacterium]